MELTKRQEKILQIVKDHGPITGERIAEILNLTRATLRPDLAILTMAGFLDARPRVGYFYVGRASNPMVSEEVRKLKVKDYKSPPVVVKENSSVYDAIVSLFLEDVGTLFVVKEGGELAGVVSRKDLLRSAMGNQALTEIPINIVMTRMPNIITCQLEESLYDVALRLIENQVDCLPVVRNLSSPGEGELGERRLEVVGRISKTTITRCFVELGQMGWGGQE